MIYCYFNRSLIDKIDQSNQLTDRYTSKNVGKEVTIETIKIILNVNKRYFRTFKYKNDIK